MRAVDPADSANVTSYFGQIANVQRPAIYIVCQGIAAPIATAVDQDAFAPAQFLRKIGSSYVDIRRVYKETGIRAPLDIDSDTLINLLQDNGVPLSTFDTAHSVKAPNLHSGLQVPGGTPGSYIRGNVRFTVNAIYETVPSADNAFSSGGGATTPQNTALLTGNLPSCPFAFDQLRQVIQKNWYYWTENQSSLGLPLMK